MPSYGSLHSPSLRKPNNFGMDMKGRRSSSSMSMDNIIGDPFALATISISVLAWFIAFVGSAIATAQHNPPFNNYFWFSIVHMLCLIIGIFVVVASETVQTYHVAIVGFLASGLILTSLAVNDLIYTSNGAMEAAAAGFILLSMVNIVWIFYFGSTPSAVPRAYLDSFALHKSSHNSHGDRGMSTGFSGRPDTSVSANVPPQMYTSAQLGGFETSSPVAGFSNDRTSTKFGASTTPTAGLGGDSQPAAEVVQPTEYPYKARAIYSYEANPDDANEISFSKHEVLEVSDVSGRWWQAKKATGETGIAPSNYLLLL